MNLKKRLVSSFIGVAIALLATAFQMRFGYALNIAIGVIIILAQYEIFYAKGYFKNKPLVYVSFFFSVCASLIPILSNKMTNYMDYYVFLLLFYAACLFFILLKTFEKTHLEQIAVAFFMSLCLSWSFSCISRVSVEMVISEYHDYVLSTFIFILMLTGAWVSDTSAYFVGSMFGKHKLAPRISPQKSVEGVIGSLVITPLFFLLLAYLFDHYFTFLKEYQVNYILIVVLGVLCATFATMGDLIFSIIKRQCGIKDYGSIMPGHGGILDRFDSVLFTSPLVLYFCIYVKPII